MKQLIQDAISYAEKKNQQGLLVWDEIPEFTSDSAASDWWSTPEGDRETVYSIAGLYSQFAPYDVGVNEARDILEDELCKKFPKFCD